MPLKNLAARAAYQRKQYLLKRTLKLRPTTEQRFWKFVAPMLDDRGCWEWVGSINNRGYGEIHRSRRTALAHRVSYELNVAAIQHGLSLDHLCRNTSCVNPAHLEPVTHSENVRRGNAAECAVNCKRGHALTADNVYRVRNGVTCRACAIERSKLRWRNQRDAGLIPAPAATDAPTAEIGE